MAGKNDKPKKPPVSNPMRSERRLTVSSLLLDSKVKSPDAPVYQTPTKVPWIRMQGKWLEEAGFSIHTPVKIRVIKGCLVLTID